MLTLTFKNPTAIPIEAECLTPENLASRSITEIERLSVQHGNASVPLVEFFRVKGDPGDRELQVEGDCSRVKWMGAGMSDGRLVIHGDAGMHLGSEMRGGVIRVLGNVGDWPGAEMRGGRIHIQGNAGHLVGGAYRGGRKGMLGGAILVHGDAGNEVGCLMRRGLIAVGGRTGDFAGASMIAGTLFLLGEPGIRTGAGMKRGSIVCQSPSMSFLPTFRYACSYRPNFLSLYCRRLAEWGFPITDGFARGIFRRYNGDLVGLGQGEILLRVSD